MEEGGYDTVIISSVVQYFPDVEYLLRVLEGAAKRVAPGGTVYVGDVTSLPYLHALLVWLQLRDAAPEASTAELWTRVLKRLEQPNMFYIDPALFATLRTRSLRIEVAERAGLAGAEHVDRTRERFELIARHRRKARVVHRRRMSVAGDLPAEGRLGRLQGADAAAQVPVLLEGHEAGG